METSGDTAALVPPLAVDLETSPVGDQMGYAVLDLANGTIVRRSSEFSTHDASILYQMLLETGNLQGLQKQTDGSMDPFVRFSVTFWQIRYVVSCDDAYVYIAQTKNTNTNS